MPFAFIISPICLGQSSLDPLIGQRRPAYRSPDIGWHDELDNVSSWKHLIIDNKPKLSVPSRGTLKLTLGQVSAGWPYEYQWSGVTRSMKINIAKYPYLGAQVTDIYAGYAHMDIDVLDADGKPYKTIRSNTLQSPGISFVNLKDHLDPATYNLQLRLIVGGPNSGCSATYNWIRFTTLEDAERMMSYPTFPVTPHHRASNTDRTAY